LLCSKNIYTGEQDEHQKPAPGAEAKIAPSPFQKQVGHTVVFGDTGDGKTLYQAFTLTYEEVEAVKTNTNIKVKFKE
jgi:hypothetical protein